MRLSDVILLPVATDHRTILVHDRLDLCWGLCDLISLLYKSVGIFDQALVQILDPCWHTPDFLAKARAAQRETVAA